MSDFKFDFNTYSKYFLSKEEQEKIVDNVMLNIEHIKEKKQEQYKALSTDEEKLKWLRVALLNAIAINIQLGEFASPLIKYLPLNSESEEGIKVIIETQTHIANCLLYHLSFLYKIKHHMDVDKKEQEEITQLEGMMK